ncbi:MAG TPA: DNA repair protein RecO, partial [Prevotella sp.]|nr:DNA repair protein RecO [Prevotella sp.]
METKTRAIVLRSVRYGDSQIIVDVFSREKGRASFICHVSKNGRGKIKQQLFQPLTILEIVYDDRPTRSLQRFRDIRLAQPFFSIPFQPKKLAIGLFIAEFLSYALRDEQCNVPLYDYVESSVTWLDNVVGQFANFHLVFMLRLSRFIGFFPNLEEMAEGDWFDLRNGVFT